MFCALSGVVPTEPVVSSKSGHLFERRLVVQQLREDSATDKAGKLGKLPVGIQTKERLAGGAGSSLASAAEPRANAPSP